MGCLYQIDFPSGKKYIGISKHSADRRAKAHFDGARLGKKTIICNAIRKYGKENCKVVTLVVANDIEYLKDLEVKAIAAFNTKYPNGYNCTKGGDGVVDLPEDLEKIRVEKMKKTMADDSYKLQMREKMKAAWTEEKREKRRQETLKLWQRSSYRKKNTKPRGAIVLSPEQLEIKRQKLKAAWQDESKKKARGEKMKLWYASLTEKQKAELNKKRAEARVGNKRSQETIERMCISQNKRWQDPELRAAAAERTRKQMQNPEQRAKIARTLRKRCIADLWAKDRFSERMKKYYSDLENRKKMSEKIKQHFSNPENRKKISEIKKQQCSDPEYRKRMSEIKKKQFLSFKYRKKISIAKKKQSSDPEYRKRMSEKIKQHFSDPEKRHQHSEIMKKYYEQKRLGN